MPSCTVNFPAIPGNDKCKGGGSVAWIGKYVEDSTTPKDTRLTDVSVAAVTVLEQSKARNIRKNVGV
jgi:hypothetical protein